MICMALGAALLLGACGGKNESKNEQTDRAAETFASSQPLASGEYRAVSFQYGDLQSDRNRFDGRIIVALSPDNSGIYIYENGNRTDFKATIALSKPFEKKDSIYVAYDRAGKPVSVIKGTENDTLVFVKRDTITTKVAFERKPMAELSASAAWERISAKIKN